MLVLNPALDRLFANLGLPSPDDFDVSKAPLFSRTETVIGIVAYLSIIFGLQFALKVTKAAPFQLKGLFFLHNAVLSVSSGILLGLMVEILVPLLVKNGMFWMICSPEGYTKRLELYYYANYMFKFYELIDTLFLVLKQKQLAFLHVYHHAATLYLSFVVLYGSATCQWVTIVLNLFVHLIMYYYYAITAISTKKIWWKKYLTTLQITQFVLALHVIYFASYNMFANTKLNHLKLPTAGNCYGSHEAATVGCLIVSSYLLLFIQFFAKTYGKGEKAAKENGAPSAKKVKKTN